MGKWEYALVLACCVVVTLPLEFAGARVYRRPGRAARAILPVAVVFLGWDVLAIAAGVWGYTPRFLLGVTLPFGLPLEEVLFFVVVPLCGLLTYESVNTVLAMARARRGNRARR
jgi:lycopene cyclase domain-containing protein